MKRYAVFFTGSMLLVSPVSGAEAKPYEKHGIVNCALPGTIINFTLNGVGGAEVADLETNYPPLRAAAKVKVWAASTTAEGPAKTLVLDNLAGSRIMARIRDGKGMAFIGDDGVSDILCQILIQAE